jgi:hypothetical protein
MANEFFLDASYAVALSSVGDRHHALALALGERLTRTGARLITTRAVVLEIGNALARLRYREAAIRLLEAIESDPQVEVVAISEELYRRGFDLYRSRPDKE